VSEADSDICASRETSMNNLRGGRISGNVFFARSALMMLPAMLGILVPIAVCAWSLWLATRAVRALESIAESLR